MFVYAGSGQFFLYYRAAQKMWTIDAELDKVAPAFACLGGLITTLA